VALSLASSNGVEATGARATVMTLKCSNFAARFSCSIAPDVPVTVFGDPSRLQQILVNLLSNSMKFTERGEVRLQVIKNSEASDGTLRFSVSDTGMGIAPEKQQLIFQAFTQADSSSSRKFGGTGLGLAITSHLVEMMGGRIWLESETDKGSTFHFTVRFELDKQA
jgi:two-component system, sensor histidine kinase and response regulator